MIFSVTQNHWQFDTVHIVYAVYDIEPETTDKKRIWPKMYLNYNYNTTVISYMDYK